MIRVKNENKDRHVLKKTLKITLITLIVLFILFWIMSFVIVHIMEGQQFARTELNYSNTSIRLIQDYEDVKTDEFSRREIEFPSDENTLRGYDYGYDIEDKKGLVVMAHGFGGNQTNYLYMAKFFVENDYEVITYDNTGTVLSDGDDMIALSHSPIDLRACLKYIESNDNYEGLDIITLGHSWGAYAVTDVMNFTDLPAIKATIAFSAFDYTPTMLRQFGIAANVAPAPLVNAIYPTMYLYELIKGGTGAFSHAYEGVNKAVDTDFMIIHGTEDELIPFDKVSLYAVREKVDNPNAVFYPAVGKDHGHVYKTLDAKAYEEEVYDKLDELRANYSGDALVEKVAELQSTVDYSKCNELDPVMMNDILEFLDK